MPLTKRGVYTNINESKYSFLLQGLEYFFSSKVYRRKFITNYLDNREYYKKRIKNYGETGDTSLFADLHLYCDLEKRGFRIEKGGEPQSWQALSECALRKMTEQNSKG